MAKQEPDAPPRVGCCHPSQGSGDLRVGTTGELTSVCAENTTKPEGRLRRLDAHSAGDLGRAGSGPEPPSAVVPAGTSDCADRAYSISPTQARRPRVARQSDLKRRVAPPHRSANGDSDHAGRPVPRKSRLGLSPGVGYQALRNSRSNEGAAVLKSLSFSSCLSQNRFSGASGSRLADRLL